MAPEQTTDDQGCDHDDLHDPDPEAAKQAIDELHPPCPGHLASVEQRIYDDRRGRPYVYSQCRWCQGRSGMPSPWYYCVSCDRVFAGSAAVAGCHHGRWGERS